MKAAFVALAICSLLLLGCCSLSAPDSKPKISNLENKKHYEGSGYSFDYSKNLTSLLDESDGETADSDSTTDILTLFGYNHILFMDNEGSLSSMLIFTPQSQDSISKSNCNLEYITNTNPDNVKRFCPKEQKLTYKGAEWYSFKDSDGCLIDAVNQSNAYTYIFVGSCSKKNFAAISSNPQNFLPIVSSIKCGD